MYKADVSKATVLALFLLPTNLDKLADKFLALPPGTRIVMNTFTVTGWSPTKASDSKPTASAGAIAALHRPAKVAGRWRFDDWGEVMLTQDFQMIQGTSLPSSADTASTINGRLRGAEITLTIGPSQVRRPRRGDR